MRWELTLLEKYFEGETLAIIAGHGRVVADLALKVCHRLGLPEDECRFVEEAALLHDIGVCRIHAPKLGLYGEHAYIMHGIIGREILEAEGFPRHALVCERHIGVGLTVKMPRDAGDRARYRRNTRGARLRESDSEVCLFAGLDD